MGEVLLISSPHAQDSTISKSVSVAHLDPMMERMTAKLHCNAPYFMALSLDAL